MNEFKIRAFGIAKDILGGKETVVRVEGTTVAALRQELTTKYPRLQGLRSLMIAVNNEYADDGKSLTTADEIALIPPVSGG